MSEHETIYVPVTDPVEQIAGLRAGADKVEPDAPDLAAKLRRAADEVERRLAEHL